MKILLVHNRYRFSGGEDQVFCREGELLRFAGHQVIEYTKDNKEIVEDGFFNRAKLGVQTLWSVNSRLELRNILRSERPEVVHFHNTFPLISPAAYYPCQEAGIPVVQSLHNSRFMCPAATLYRQGRICQDCLGKCIPWPGIFHSCYRNSSLQTAAVAGMLTLHRLLGTWQERVDAYIVFTEFFRRKAIEGGLPRKKIFVKPHFLGTDPGMKQNDGDYALFVGRFAPEKGIATLLKAWDSLSHVPLRLVGTGPMEQEVRHFSQTNHSIHMLPYLSQEECFDVIKGARFLVWPSSAETFGLVAIESFACGTPVIASRANVMAEVVQDRKTGLHFEAGAPEDLAAKVDWAWTHPREMAAMGRAARAEYESKYTPERNYRLLMEIYAQARNATARKAA